MNKRFYPRFAWDCMRKNRRFYTPYLTTVMGAAAGFYMLATTADPRGLADAGDVRVIMQVCTAVLGLVCAGFLLYTNGFLMRQRGREFGLYSVLGMTRENLARLMLWESVYTLLIGLGGGLFLGALFDRLLLLLLARLMGAALTGPVLYVRCMVLTAGVFGAILLLIFAVNAVRVGLMRPVDLITSQSAGGKAPKARWLIAGAGLILVGAGYVIAIGRPALMQAVETEDILWFFIAVLLVILGTFALFLAGTVTGLMLLRRWKGYYYKTRHFIAVSGLIHRMGRNAAGLAIICVLSTAVLVMVSSTVSLYAGLESNVRQSCPRDVMCEFTSGAQTDWDELLDGAVDEIRAAGYHPQNTVRYCFWECRWEQNGAGGDMVFLDAAGYETITGRKISLKPGQILTTWPEDTLSVLDMELDAAGHLEPDDPAAVYLGLAGADSQYGRQGTLDGRHLAVAGADTIEQVRRVLQSCLEAGSDASLAFGTYGDHLIDFDLPAGEDTHACRVLVEDHVVKHFRPLEAAFGSGCRDAGTIRASLMANYGSLLFLGLFLGALFLGGAALLIYYKQLSEGYEDRSRFAVLEQVGMDAGMARKSIRSQILLVFFLPLLTAFCHTAAAFPLVDRMLGIWGMYDTGVFALCTLASAAVFTALYGAVYALTARTYTKIVRE